MSDGHAETADATAQPLPTSIWRLLWRVSQHEPRSFWLGWVTFVIFFTLPALAGYLLGRGFEALSEGDNSAVYRFAALLAVRRGGPHGDHPLRRHHVDQGVGAHADDRPRQPARSPRWRAGAPRPVSRSARRGRR